MYIVLTAQQIIELHDTLLGKYGGLSGIKDPGMIELAAEKPFTAYFGQEQFPGLFLKAACYLQTIATGHFFMDGNKRTATMTAIVFLDLNGYEIDVDWETFFETVIFVAKKELSLEQLAEWLEVHSRPKDKRIDSAQ